MVLSQTFFNTLGQYIKVQLKKGLSFSEIYELGDKKFKKSLDAYMNKTNGTIQFQYYDIENTKRGE